MNLQLVLDNSSLYSRNTPSMLADHLAFKHVRRAQA